MTDQSPRENRLSLRELEELWFDIADGNEDPDKLRRLNDALRNDPKLREHLAEFLIDDVILEKELEVNSVESALQRPTLPVSTTGRSFSWTWVMAVALSLLFLTSSVLLYREWIRPNSLGEEHRADVAIEKRLDADQANDEPTKVSPQYLATVTQSDQSTWKPSMESDAKLTAGTYRLKSGTARLMMSNGVELVVDAQRSVTEFELVSPRLVLLNTGTLIASVIEQEIGFTIETPTTHVIDAGTEFAVTVSADGSRVEVLDGAVSTKPQEGSAEPNYALFASERATQFSNSADSVGKDVDGEKDRLRSIQQSVRTPLPDSIPLQAFDDFANSELLGANQQRDGWRGPWRYGSFDGDAAKLITKPGPLAGIPAWLPSGSPSYLVQPTYSIHCRNLDRPMELDRDADYFISLLIQKRIVSASDQFKQEGVGFTLFSASKWREDAGIGFSLDGTNRFTVWTDANRYNGGKYGEADVTYFVVMKVEASAIGKDNLFVKTYVQGDAMDFTEPKNWDVVGKASARDLKLDMMATWSGENCFALIDQIRIGESWQSVSPVR